MKPTVTNLRNEGRSLPLHDKTLVDIGPLATHSVDEDVTEDRHINHYKYLETIDYKVVDGNSQRVTEKDTDESQLEPESDKTAPESPKATKYGQQDDEEGTDVNSDEDAEDETSPESTKYGDDGDEPSNEDELRELLLKKESSELKDIASKVGVSTNASKPETLVNKIFENATVEEVNKVLTEGE